MLLRLDNVTVSLEAEAQDRDAALAVAIAERLDVSPEALTLVTPLKRSLDPRGTPRLVYSAHAELEDAAALRRELPKGVRVAEPFYKLPHWRVPAHRKASRAIVIGAGPAGLFAALALARAGLRPILLEQGKPVETRAMDVSRLMHWGELQRQSNLCFGEGGAGTWSDGKLTTRIGASQVRFVLETLVEMGAPERILLDGKPHLGTDKLIALLKKLRAAMMAQGADIRFGCRVTRLLLEGGEVRGVVLGDGERVEAEHVVLAAGHSSRALVGTLLSQGVAVERKAFAVGFRVEHPQQTINTMQYGRHAQNPKLPPADYRVTANLKVDGVKRGVYSFCMCPGGQVVPTPTEPDGVVVNGMSHAARSGPWANSALVVTVRPEDFGGPGPLAGFDFQRRAERRAGALGGGFFRAPAQTLTGFLKNKPDTAIRKTSYTPGVTPADLSRCYPEFVNTALREALRSWKRRMAPFVTRDAVLIGVETRTSAPVRLVRGDDLQSISHRGLYPCGEGSGYGGGIVSAAVDGLRCAEAVLVNLGAEADPRG